MPASPAMPPTARPTQLTLRVHDAASVADFYEAALGLAPVGDAPDRVLAPPGEGFRLVLEEAPDAPARPPKAAGLFHAALLVPDRAALAGVLARLAEREVRLAGAADHGVSEAVYLVDPAGNGLELYHDRPREAWPTRGDEVAMVTEPLDVESLLDEAEAPRGLPDDARLGHVHLQVPAVDEAGAFYRALGLRVRQSTYPGALFLAAGDYHHHVGLNAWGGVQAPVEGAVGLAAYTWTVPADGWDAWREDVDAELEATDGGVEAVDPAGVRVRAETGAPPGGGERER